MNGSGDYQAVIATPLGRVGIRMSGEALSALDYLPADVDEQAPVNVGDRGCRNPVDRLFSSIHSPCSMCRWRRLGRRFNSECGKALQAIPTGSVLSYGELAQRLDTAPRAIGGACRSNPIPILIPCHRVVSRQGLGGYAGEVKGDPLAIKRWLLRHEGVAVE
jgi:methylated-DNA-[protein]-cysteine S-methyltransferase